MVSAFKKGSCRHKGKRKMQWGAMSKEVTFQLRPTVCRFLLDEQGKKRWSKVRDKEEEKMER